MITLNDNKPVFLQIKAWIEDHILRGEWQQGEQLPSVRELAATFGVNPNTVARTYERLTMEGTAYSTKGVGLFVATCALENIQTRRREEFFATTLPSFIEQMQLLGITPEDITKLYNSKNNENK